MLWFAYTAEALWIIAQCFLTWCLLDTIAEEKFRHGITMSVFSLLSISIVASELCNVIIWKSVASSGTLTFYSVVFAIMSLFLYKNKTIPKIQTCILTWEFGRLLDYLIQTVLYIVLYNDVANPRIFQTLGIPRGILLLLYSGALLLISKRLAYAYKRILVGSWLFRKPGFLFSASFWCLLVFFQRIYYSREDLVNEGYLFLWQLLFIAVVVFVLIIWILQRRWKLLEENRLQRQQIEFMEKKQEQLIEQYQERKQLVHDSKNNLITLQHYIDKGDLSGANKYLTELIPERKETSIYRWSGHEILDMIFSIKAEAAGYAGIECRIFSDDLTGIKLTDVEISSLFSNLLDNAIEAQAGKENINEKWIDVKVKRKQETLFINVRNPYEGTVQFENGKPKTSKQNKKEHGVGGLLIEKIVDRYDGGVRIRTDDHIFDISIIMNAF